LRKTIVCLANSYKHGGRCIAGIDVGSSAWVRLCGRSPDGALGPAEYMLDAGGEPRMLDLIGVDLDRAIPSNAHPEDWKIAPGRWNLLERPAASSRIRPLLDRTEASRVILGGCRDRISATEITCKPRQTSLTLIKPSDIHWWIRDESGKRRSRALFHCHHVAYDLPVTDPHWLDLLNLLPAGIYPHCKLADDGGETWFTASLSEAYFGWHYKLVAAVIVQRPLQSDSSLCEPSRTS
jgi:hypothetical protein